MSLYPPFNSFWLNRSIRGHDIELLQIYPSSSFICICYIRCSVFTLTDDHSPWCMVCSYVYIYLSYIHQNENHKQFAIKQDGLAPMLYYFSINSLPLWSKGIQAIWNFHRTSFWFSKWMTHNKSPLTFLFPMGLTLIPDTDLPFLPVVPQLSPRCEGS